MILKSLKLQNISLNTHTIQQLAILLCLYFISFAEIDARNISHVIIDPGHGGHDPGAGRHSVYEKGLTLSVALKVEKLLKAKGLPVTLTRRSDRFVSLRARATVANQFSNAVFVSIHFNANHSSRLHGVETYYYGDNGRKLASHVHLRLLSNLKARDGRIRQRKDFVVLHATKATSILVECGYLSNTNERVRCNTLSYQNKCAKAIADGIWAYKTYN